MSRPRISPRLSLLVCLALWFCSGIYAQDDAGAEPGIQSMSVLTFAADGTLFVGDSKAATIWALDLGERPTHTPSERLVVTDIETKIAALLGTRASEVLIHDLATDPVSADVYLAVSRGRSTWDNRWQLPNDLTDATLLIRVDAAGQLEAVELSAVTWTSGRLPNPVAPDKQHRWKQGTSLRVDTITDIAIQNATVYVSGLSNEEFASTLWKLPYPFDGQATASTLEIFHGAHGEYETHAPIRTFLPYRLEGRDHLLAAYLCTPLVTFESASLAAGAHVKGRTVAEFGSGNYPLDMVVYRNQGVEKIAIANSNLPLMLVDPRDIEAYEGSITRETPGYTEGVRYEIRSGNGIQQLDRYGDEMLVALQRLPGGTLDLVSMSVRRL